MNTYEITVVRTEGGTRTYTVTADTHDDAMTILEHHMVPSNVEVYMRLISSDTPDELFGTCWVRDEDSWDVG